jgi:hypothetical protein
MKNQHGLNEEKHLIGKKIISHLSASDVMWLVWILTTKRKSMKRVENFERYVIFFCYYSLILLIRQFVLLW